MKQRLPVLLAAAALSLAGCSPREEAAQTTETPPAASNPTESSTPTPGTMGPPGPAAVTPPGPAGNGKVVTTPTGLKYEDVKVGTGATAKAGNTVTVHYTGTFENGTKFDSSRDRNEPFTFTLGRDAVIQGWHEGVAGMKKGGQRKLTIPGDLAYGPEGRDPIPPNATLLFDIELLEIN